MASTTIDVKKLSKEEVVILVKNLFKENLITNELLEEMANINSKNTSQEELAYIEQLIEKHFEEYDEVFRKLA